MLFRQFTDTPILLKRNWIRTFPKGRIRIRMDTDLGNHNPDPQPRLMRCTYMKLNVWIFFPPKSLVGKKLEMQFIGIFGRFEEKLGKFQEISLSCLSCYASGKLVFENARFWSNHILQSLHWMSKRSWLYSVNPKVSVF